MTRLIRGIAPLALLAATPLTGRAQTPAEAPPAEPPPTEAEAAADAAAAEAEAAAAEADLYKAMLGAVIMQVAEKALGPAAPPAEPPAPPPGLKDNAPADLHAELDRVEGDLLTLGIFPNSSGFMDAKLYFRKTYLEYFSSGIYFDYLTFQLQSEVEGEDGPTARSDTLDRQYRVEADALKGILPLHRWVFDSGDADGGTLFTVEPGLNAKFIIDQIESSGYRRNGLGESVFLNEEKDVLQFGASAKLEISLAAGEWFAFDGSFEYLPYIYSQETAQKLNSQFPEEPIEAEIVNGTSGLQATVDVIARDLPVGKFTLRGRLYRNSGRVNTESTVVTGNFETEVKTSTDYAENTYWLELTHSMTYLKPWTQISPAVAVALQRREVTTNDRESVSDTFKVGLLAEFF
ncbi:hypothetical protein L6V77_22935 [Myxococcota bacterium]|nr:hypothetical protein [Myxococcota bacterium]